ncbi:protein kinase [bacterium]|nr:protein kinase [bacterium]
MDKIEGFEPIPFGKYLLIEKIGAGGMAEIFKAKTFGVSGFEKVLVIKRILPKFCNDDEFRGMFINEAKLTAGLQHNNIVQIYELGEINQQYFIAMEYIDGKDLLHLLRKSSKRREYIPLNVIIFILKEIFTGLGYAHSAKDENHNPLNIIHRDISPSNILISYNGVVKISDFGIARAQNRDIDQTKTGQFKGKLGYMSPEQVLGDQIDSRSDIFAGGIIAFEMLTLTRLFQGNNDIDILNKITNSEKIKVRSLNAAIPEALANVIDRILEKNFERRFQTAEDVVEALDEVAYQENLRMTRSKFSEFLHDIFAEEIVESRKAVYNKTRYLYAKDNKAETTGVHPTGYITYIPKVEEDPNFSQKVVYLSPSRYVSTDVGDVYYINDGRNPVLGPITLGTIASLIKSEKLTGKEFFSNDGQNWKLVEFFPELNALFSMHASTQQKEVKPDYQSSLATTSFIRLLYRYFSTSVTGLVKIYNSEGVKKEVIFKNGQPIFIKSNKKSELLGNFLLKEGKITQEQLKEALNVMGNFNNRLGETLISKGILQPFEVFELLSKQVKEKLYEIFTWRDGTFEFYSEFKMVPIIVPINISFYETVLNGVSQYYPTDKLHIIFSKRGHLKIKKKQNTQIQFQQFKFSPTYYKIFKGIQYDHTIARNLELIPELTHEKKTIFYQILYLLYEIETILLEP